MSNRILKAADHTRHEKTVLSVSRRMLLAFILSTFLTASIAGICSLILEFRTFPIRAIYSVPMIWSVLIGALLGGLVVSPFFKMLTRKVHIWHATNWCFGCSTLCVILYASIWATSNDQVTSTLVGFVGFFIGNLVSRKLSPRYKVYKYGTCPGCGYSLVHLPKSVPCPECGRDNTDLANVFADIGIKKSDLSAAP
ncbi:MAG: hypothetical protein P1U42_04985 [Phycisphaerales bacterium]|nr:hypothetical protein [Phycisphaerales bacterium]